MSEPTQAPTLPIPIEPLVAQIKESLPLMITGRDKAVARMSQITVIEDDEDLEVVNQVLVNSKTAIEKINGYRTVITRPLDQLKSDLMQYEKDVKAQDDRVRGLVAAYNQVKLDKRLEEEKEAAARRAKEDYKVELTNQIKQNFINMVSERVKATEEWSRQHFEAATVENFDAKAKMYNGITPKLNQKYYEGCVLITFDTAKMTSDEWIAFEAETRATETYDKWNKQVMDEIIPILNHWRGRLPELKQQKIDLAKADADEKARLLEQKSQQDAADVKRRADELAQKQAAAQENLNNETQVNLMGNLFQEQASVQSLDPKGNTKKELRFVEDTNLVKPFANVIFHCFLSPKFTGVYKKDKDGNFVLDEHDNREFVDHVGWWMRFFQTNCKEVVAGTEVKEMAKVIVRK